MSAEVARILREAAALIEPPGRWTKGHLARDAEGFVVPPTHPSATCWCADGAIIRCGGLTPSSEHAFYALAGHVGARLGGVGVWNDAQPSAESVVAALRAAADEAEVS